MPHYDMLILGHVSKDINITPESEERAVGGAVVFSSIAAKRSGANILALTKLHEDDLPALDIFGRFDVPVVHQPSARTTSIRNTYHTADRERRTCEGLAMADPFQLEDIPEDTTADLYYLGGLMRGEFPEKLMGALAERGPVAMDVQGFLRVNEAGTMSFRDWPRKRELLPVITRLKTDAAEAEILTGIDDPEHAARTLHEWGPAEVMLTHTAGVTVCADDKISFAPFTARNLSGRTGRGDTCFASYCSWRREHSPEEAGRFAAALTSLKMEQPGPFAGTPGDVEQVLAERYE